MLKLTSDTIQSLKFRDLVIAAIAALVHICTVP